MYVRILCMKYDLLIAICLPVLKSINRRPFAFVLPCRLYRPILDVHSNENFGNYSTSNYSTEVSVETRETSGRCSIDDMSSNNILIRDFFTQISWPLGSLVSGVDFELKDPGFKPHTAQKRKTKFQRSTRRVETRINFFTDSIRA
jgi:hypothetical protein